MNKAFVSFNEEELEYCIMILEIDLLQYEGVIDDFTKMQCYKINSIIQKMKNVKKSVYGD